MKITKLQLTAAGGLAVLLLLLWLIISRWLEGPETSKLPSATTGAGASKPAKPPPSNEEPAYIVEGDKVKVNVPGLGWVTGVKHPDVRLQGIALSCVPEILVTDAEGHFLYLRTHKPQHRAKRDFKAWDAALERDWKSIEETSSESFPATKILGPGRKLLSDPVVFEELGSQANGGAPESWDIEIWGLRMQTPLHGQRDGFLVSRTDGRAGNPGGLNVPSKGGLSRELRFWGYFEELGGFIRTSAGAYVFEEWLADPSFSDEDYAEGQDAVNGNARRQFESP